MVKGVAADKLTPLQRAIYDVDQLGVNLRDSMRYVTQRVGFFVGQERYVQEQKKIAEILAAYGDAAIPDGSPSDDPVGATHSAGSTGA